MSVSLSAPASTRVASSSDEALASREPRLVGGLALLGAAALALGLALLGQWGAGGHPLLPGLPLLVLSGPLGLAIAIRLAGGRAVLAILASALILGVAARLAGAPDAQSAALAGVLAAEHWLGWRLLRRGRLAQRRLTGPVAFVRFLAVAAVVPPLLGASLLAVWLAPPPGGDFRLIWLSWYAASAVGTVVGLPGWISALDNPAPERWRPWVDPANLLRAVMVAGAVWLAILRLPQPQVHVAGVMAFVAVRAGLPAVAGLACAVAALSVALDALGWLPVASGGSSTALLSGEPALTAALAGVLAFHLPLMVAVVPPMLLAVLIARAGRRSALSQARDRARYRRLWLRAPVMMVWLDLSGRVMAVSERWLLDTGRLRSEVLGRLFSEFIAPPDAARLAQRWRTLQAGTAEPAARGLERDDSAEDEFDLRHADGRCLRVSARSRVEHDPDGRVSGVLLALTDVTEQRRLEALLSAQARERIDAAEKAAARMAHLAQHDPLTGLPNRLLFLDRLRQGLRGARGQPRGLGLIFIDLDHFKRVNDEHGHAVGDALLCAVAERLRGQLRDSDTLCRLGGDEFVVLLPGVTQRARVAEVAGKLMAAAAEPYRLGGSTLAVTFSGGIALAPEDGEEPQALMDCADAAMYRAKRAGRNRVGGAGDPGASAMPRPDAGAPLQPALSDR
ncbi:MAG: diguanylate cyclase [Betaproteobacteria bacterium]|nr:diguanylate cyclase [Betaproteobacteria bacterium]